MQKCWELKKCGADQEGSRNAQCPVYKSGTACWEFDWETFWSNLPAGDEKEKNKVLMAEECNKCVVKKVHASEVGLFLDIIRDV